MEVYLRCGYLVAAFLSDGDLYNQGPDNCFLVLFFGKEAVWMALEKRDSFPLFG